MLIWELSGEVGLSDVEVLSTGNEYWKVFLLELSECNVRIGFTIKKQNWQVNVYRKIEKSKNYSDFLNYTDPKRIYNSHYGNGVLGRLCK